VNRRAYSKRTTVWTCTGNRGRRRICAALVPRAGTEGWSPPSVRNRAGRSGSRVGQAIRPGGPLPDVFQDGLAGGAEATNSTSGPDQRILSFRGRGNRRMPDNRSGGWNRISRPGRLGLADFLGQPYSRSRTDRGGAPHQASAASATLWLAARWLAPDRGPAGLCPRRAEVKTAPTPNCPRAIPAPAAPDVPRRPACSRNELLAYCGG